MYGYTEKEEEIAMTTKQLVFDKSLSFHRPLLEY